MVDGSGDCGVEGRATLHAWRPTALLGVGNHRGADAAGGFPPGAAPDRRADRTPSSVRVICDRGNNIGVSIGPSYRPAAGDNIPATVRFVTDHYTAKYAAEPADLIVRRHVLEHFGEARPLIATVRQAVGDRTNSVVYFEVPNEEFILRE